MIPSKNRQKFYDRFGEVYYLREFDFLPEPIVIYPQNLKYGYIEGCIAEKHGYGKLFYTREEAADASNRVRETLGLPKWDSSDWVKGSYTQDYGLRENEVTNEELRKWLSERKEEQGKAEANANKFYYIENTVDETDSDITAYCKTLDDAKERLKTCRDWYGEMGTGRIYEVKFGGDPIGKLVYEKE